MIPKDSKRFQKNSKDSNRFQMIPKDSKDFEKFYRTHTWAPKNKNKPTCKSNVNKKPL